MGCERIQRGERVESNVFIHSARKERSMVRGAIPARRAWSFELFLDYNGITKG